MRALARALRARAVHGWCLLRLPHDVRRFYWSAWRLRSRLGDEFSLGGATKPRELAPLLRAAEGARSVVEVGTGTGWTAISLALAEKERTVLTIDPVHRPLRERYLELVPPSAAERVTFAEGLGERPPAEPSTVDFLFIDANHDRQSTEAAFVAWRERLTPGAAVAFHDYEDPAWPGVTEAVQALGLDGTAHHHLFVWRNPE